MQSSLGTWLTPVITHEGGRGNLRAGSQTESRLPSSNAPILTAKENMENISGSGKGSWQKGRACREAWKPNQQACT